MSSQSNTRATRPLMVWVCHDGRAGHISQLKGLTKALARQTNIEELWLDSQTLQVGFRGLLLPTRQDNSPDIIIGAGHGTHKSLLMLARTHRAKSFVIMKPSLPLPLFDGVICPEHDGLANSERVMTTQGPITKISPSPNTKRTQHLMMIGGPSKHFVWDESNLIKQIQEICDTRREVLWHLSDSPRTPLSFIDKISSCEIANLSCHRYQDGSFGPVDEALQSSAFTWVTPDSMSMLYESLTSGSPTALLELPMVSKSEKKRICMHINRLTSSGKLIDFGQWQSNKKAQFYPDLPASLDEASAAATWLLKRYQQLSLTAQTTGQA